MNPNDFKGIFKWKFLIPGIYILSWLLLIFGPIFFPYAYQIYCIIIVVYSLLKTLGLGLGSLIALIMLYVTLHQLKSIKSQTVSVSASQQRIDPDTTLMLYHIIVIPSYKEDEQVLQQTINKIAMNQSAKSRFVIMLAMEAHQKGSQTKAQGLITKNKQNFLYMGFTQHQVKQNQFKGKASNVSWCVEHLEQSLPKNLMINLDQILLTIIDADSWAPTQYFTKMQIQLNKKPQIKHRCMFSVPQIYTRNHLKVPVFNRLYDQMHSLVHLANMVAVKFSFPLSNYTISYNLAKKIGWWDTCADAIGQDFHTCQKAYWKLLDQNVLTIPIYTPFNQLSLSTGEGYCNDIKARFWQAERHTLGVTDVAYCWNMLFKTKFKFRNFILTLLVTQVFAMAAVIPWALLGLGIQYKLVPIDSMHKFPMWVIDLLLNATPIFTVSSYIFYEWWKRLSQSKIYHSPNDKWWRIFEYPILFTIALFGFSIPSFLMASFAVLCTTTEYKVAQKHIEKVQTDKNKKQKLQYLHEQAMSNQIITPIQIQDQATKSNDEQNKPISMNANDLVRKISCQSLNSNNGSESNKPLCNMELELQKAI